MEYISLNINKHSLPQRWVVQVNLRRLKISPVAYHHSSACRCRPPRRMRCAVIAYTERIHYTLRDRHSSLAAIVRAERDDVVRDQVARAAPQQCHLATVTVKPRPQKAPSAL